jgi:hypothetical protein
MGKEKGEGEEEPEEEQQQPPQGDESKAATRADRRYARHEGENRFLKKR